MERVISEEAGTMVESTEENDSGLSFELFTAPPIRVLPRDSTSLKDANVSPPTCLIHLRWEGIESEGKRWAHKLEACMGKTLDCSVYPRLPYSLRYDGYLASFLLQIVALVAHYLFSSTLCNLDTK